MSRIPIIVVLGATGTGKSKLAVQIAKKFHGEIISADSMQVYKGLNIMSNKITESEKDGVPHYLLDVCKPTDQFTVLDFRNRALAIIDDMRKRGKLPIIVGGTTYYIESILWNTLMEEPTDKTNELVFHRCRVVNDTNKLDRWRTYSKRQVNSVTDNTIDELNLPNTVTNAFTEGHNFRLVDVVNQLGGNTYSKGQVNSVTDNFIDELNLPNTVTNAFIEGHNFKLVDVVNQLGENLIQLQKVFGESIRDSISELRLNFSLYRRTFYPVTKLQNHTNVDFDIPVENGHQEINKISIESIVDVEKQLLNELVFVILEKTISHFKKKNLSSYAATLEKENATDANIDRTLYSLDCTPIWNEKNMYSILVGSGMTTRENVLRKRVYESDIQNKLKELLDWHRIHEDEEEGKFRKLMNEMRDIIYEIMNIRLKRLKLVRIIDDDNMVDYSTEDLYSELKLIDSKTANTLHPNDRRKIIRAVQLFMSTGKTVNQLRKEQHKPVTNADTVTDDKPLDENRLPLRYPNALILWLRCDQDVLNERLVRRVDEMISSGLINELELFHKQYNLARLKNNSELDYTKGVFQSIGLKEFHSYLMLSAEDRESDVGLKQLRSALNRLKRTNIQYSKTQNRHIINKFVNVPDYKQVPLVFELNSADLQKSLEEVDLKVFELIDRYLKKETNDWWLPYSPVPRVSADPRRFLHGEFFCTSCQRLFTNQHQLSVHNTSRSHQKCVYNQKVRELQRKMVTVRRPNSCRCNSEEDVFCDILWEEWNLN